MVDSNEVELKEAKCEDKRKDIHSWLNWLNTGDRSGLSVTWQLILSR